MPFSLLNNDKCSVINQHTINNANPYQGVTVTEGHGKYPVIFEPLQNVQTS